MFAVVSFNAAAPNGSCYIFAKSVYGTANARVLLSTGSIGVISTNSSQFYSTVQEPSITSYHILEFVTDRTNGLLNCYSNGTLFSQITTPADTTTSWTSGYSMLIGAYNLQNGGYMPGGPEPGLYMYGDICEIIMYTSKVTTAQRQQVESYLSLKWDIPLYTTGNATSIYNVVGNTVPDTGSGTSVDLSMENYLFSGNYSDYNGNFITQTIFSPSGNFVNVAMNGTGQYVVGTSINSGIYVSTNAGYSWFTPTLYNLNDSMVSPSSYPSWGAISVSASGQYMSVTSQTTLFVSSNYGMSFQQQYTHTQLGGSSVSSNGSLLSLTVKTFSPLVFNPLIWLDGNDSAGNGSFATGTVSTWYDKSGNGNHFTPLVSLSGTVYAPSVVTNAVNGLSVVNFSGLNYYLANALAAGTFSNGMYIFTVFKVNTATTYTALITRTNNTSPGYYTFDMYNDQRFISNTSNWNNLEYSSGWNMSAQTTTNLMTQLLTPTSYNEFINGSNYNNVGATNSFNTSNVAFSDSINNRITLGSRGDGVTSFNGYICETLIFNSQPSQAVQQKIEGYLAWKWGVSLNSNHPYGQASLVVVPSIGSFHSTNYMQTVTATLSLVVTGGTAPYTYSWTTVGNGATITGTTGNNSSVTLTAALNWGTGTNLVNTICLITDSSGQVNTQTFTNWPFQISSALSISPGVSTLPTSTTSTSYLFTTNAYAPNGGNYNMCNLYASANAQYLLVAQSYSPNQTYWYNYTGNTNATAWNKTVNGTGQSLTGGWVSPTGQYQVLFGYGSYPMYSSTYGSSSNINTSLSTTTGSYGGACSSSYTCQYFMIVLSGCVYYTVAGNVSSGGTPSFTLMASGTVSNNGLPMDSGYDSGAVSANGQFALVTCGYSSTLSHSSTLYYSVNANATTVASVSFAAIPSTSFSPVNTGPFHACAISASGSVIAVGGTQGLWISYNGNSASPTFTRVSTQILAGTAFALSMSYNGQVIAYSNNTNGFFVSLNGGSTFSAYTVPANIYGSGTPNITLNVSPFGNLVQVAVGYGLSLGSIGYFLTVSSA